METSAVLPTRDALMNPHHVPMKNLLALLLLLALAIPLTSCVSHDHHDDHAVGLTRQGESDHPRRHTVPPARAVYELP